MAALLDNCYPGRIAGGLLSRGDQGQTDPFRHCSVVTASMPS